jgi:acetyltransferase-like isoleucine patch superfamily enzyme
MTRIYEVRGTTVTVGEYTYGHDSVTYHAWGEGSRAFIGKYCSISAEVHMLLGGNHRTDWASMYPFGHWGQEVFGAEQFSGSPSTKGDIVIENDVWIGIGATILSGVTIGNGSVIGSRAVVAKDVPPFSIVVGNPGQVVKTRFPTYIIQLLEEIAYWDLHPSIVNQIKADLCKPVTREGLIALKEKIKQLQ